MGDPTDSLPASAAPPPAAEATTPQAPASPKSVPAPAPAAPAAAPPIDETVESHFWLTRSDQLIFGMLLFVAIGLVLLHWVRLSHWGTQTVEIERLPARQAEFRLDANAATWVEWSQIQGIGDGLARRIVADREQNGPFQSVDDLARIKGIGPKTLEHLRPWVRVNGEAAPTEPPPKRKRSRSRAKAAPKPAETAASAE